MNWLADMGTAWSLFGIAWTASLAIAASLALLGILVVVRGQAFLGAAVAQSSTLGCALALAGGGILAQELPATVMAILFAVGGAVFVAADSNQRSLAHDSRCALLFALTASAAVLVVSYSPHGLEEVHRLVASSLLGATPTDLDVFCVLLALIAFSAIRLRRTLCLFAIDPVMAAAVGVPTRTLQTLHSLTTGLCLGLAIRSSGLLYSFGMLVLPTLLAQHCTRETLPLFWLAPLLAVLCTIPAFVLAHLLDLPPAQLAVCGLAVLVLSGMFVRRIRARRAARPGATG